MPPDRLVYRMQQIWHATRFDGVTGDPPAK
jgi:hypothetical protein